jgi:Tat protein translocase TatC
MSVGEHLEELRRRIIYVLLGMAVSTGLSLVFAPRIISLLKIPYVNVMERLGLEPNLAVLDVAGGLVSYLKIALYAGLILAAPFILYQVWAFVSVGLYEREKRYVRRSVPFSSVLFVGGVAFFLLVVAQRVLYFLLALAKWLGMVPVITFPNFMSFMMRMMVVFGLAFQTPLAILVLGMTGLVSARALNRYRKHVIVTILALAAMLTPPDPFSQIALGLPMWGLYELGVLLVYLFVRKRSPEEPIPES